MPERVLEATVYVEAPFDAVWTALTDAEWHEDWHLSPCRTFGQRRGRPCEWGEAGAPVIVGRIESFRPSRGEVTHTFAFSHLDDAESLVEWQVEQLGRIVRVDLRHTLAARSAETAAIVGPGWPLALSRLKTLVETGKPMALPAEE